MKVTKAVLPVAGLGTRFLPVTKAVPKEMLPLADRPCLEYIVAEAVEAGLTELIFVTAAGKGAMVDYFHRSLALEEHLEAAGKLDLAREVRRVGELGTVITVRQERALGLGHAVLMAARPPTERTSRSSSETSTPARTRAPGPTTTATASSASRTSPCS